MVRPFVDISRDACYASPVWNVLLARTPEAEQAIVKASLTRTLDQIPMMLEGMV